MNDSQKAIIPRPDAVLIEPGVSSLLDQIRPHWHAKNLIRRVTKLISVDPSSACQRLFNASIHDLKEKIVLAGLDIAQEAAKQNKFPDINKPEHVECLDVKRTINLAYYMGLLSHPECRRLLRVYDIRRDLEHEDDDYEATVEDCFYIFKTCVDVVLSRDPVQLLKLTDIKGLVEAAAPAVITKPTLDDYSQAPVPRQTEIFRFLIGTALDSRHPDIIRQNAFNVIGAISSLTNTQVTIACAEEFIQRIGRKAPDFLHARIAFRAGILPYLKRAQLEELFYAFAARLRDVGHSFKHYGSHGDLLRNLQEIGGLTHCPEDCILEVLEWLVLCYIGEPGGYGYWGSGRKVFYSDIGAPICKTLIEDSGKNFSGHLDHLRNTSDRIRSSLNDENVCRRFETLVDIFNQ